MNRSLIQSRTRLRSPHRLLALAAASVAVLTIHGGAAVAQPATFGSTTQTVTVDGTGAFPIAFSNTTPPIEIPFDVSGLVGELVDVSVDVDVAHTWVGDLRATLLSPGGSVSHALLDRPGLRPGLLAGYFANLDGLYTFHDGATQSLLATASPLGNPQVIPPGEYRTSNRTVGGGEDTVMTATFAGLADLNGTWRLRVEDLAVLDQGTLRGASLTLTTTLPVEIQGFFAPVGDGDNTVKAGSTVPLKFRVFDGDTEITDPAVIASVVALKVPCEGEDSLPEGIEIVNKGNTGLRYAEDSFIVNWKTPRTPGCYEVTVTTVDETRIVADVTLR